MGIFSRHKKKKEEVIQQTCLGVKNGELVENSIHNTLVDGALCTMTCPKCGSPMVIDHGTVFECPYCGNKLYVISQDEVEALGISIAIPTQGYNYFKDQGREDIADKVFENEVKHRAVEKLAEGLIEKGYLQETSMIPDIMGNFARINYIIKVIKPKEKKESNL